MASSELRWHPEAIEDAEDARNWYADRSPMAARGFLLELSSAVAAVVEAPQRWPLGRSKTRRYVFSGTFPFTLVYKVFDDRLEIVAVAHQKRQPEFWLGRT
jgi:plasmid stabilization system protein ParE